MLEGTIFNTRTITVQRAINKRSKELQLEKANSNCIFFSLEKGVFHLVEPLHFVCF